MPLAGEECLVTGSAERLRNRELVEREMIRITRRQQPRIPPPTARLIPAAHVDVIRDSGPLRIPARHHARARRTTDRASRVSRRKPHPTARQPVYIRRLIKRAAEAPQ